MVVHEYHPSNVKGKNRRITVQVGLSINAIAY
jgi:hypothetical protein